MLHFSLRNIFYDTGYLFLKKKFMYTIPMKFLHVGDLHLGKTFHEHSLIDDQEHMLNQLTQELVLGASNNDEYGALIIAGDVYDRAVPPPEAVTLFDAFLSTLHQKLPELHIIIIPGNHDSGKRLAFASSMLKFQKIHIASTPQDIVQPIIINSVAFYPLPFLHPDFFSDGQVHQEAMIQTAVQQILQYHQDNHPEMAKVLIAHLFTQGSLPSDSERVFIGTAELVDGQIFKDFDYVALGHLHRCQNPGKNIWYSGSPLAYSFSESDNNNCFLKVELSTQLLSSNNNQQRDLRVEKIPVIPLHRVCRLQGKFEDFYSDPENKYAKYKDSYLEISATDLHLKENPISLLQGRYPYLLSYRQDNVTANSNSTTMEQRRELLKQAGEMGYPTAEIFTAFMKDIYDELPENFEEELNLFKKILEENK